MIIVKIFQGLGNQMFQYAFGKAISLDLKTDLKLDTSYYDTNSVISQYGYTYKRDFGLNRFNINALEATPEDISSIRYPIGNNLYTKLLNRYRMHFGGKHQQFHVHEVNYMFDHRFLRVLNNTYVEGYFTFEQYFADIRDVLLKEFTLKTPISLKNAEIISKMLNCNSVGISIRRTNFLNNPIHGTCGQDYYYSAMDEMAKRVDNPVFFVFSDDNEWVNLHFKSKYNCIFIQHNYPDFYEDFRLLSSCKNHIIPNSTFPWWAAWLSNDPNKVVIAPRHWLNSKEIDYTQFIPTSWIKIDNQINTYFDGDKK